MSARAIACGVVLALLVAGCGTIKRTIDPEAAQLERFKELGAARQFAAIAAREVRCAEGDELCRQLHLIKGDACFALARRDRAAIAHYECAIAELGAGLDGGLGQDTALGPNQPFALKLLEALRERRDLSGSAAESRPHTARLVQEARAFRTVHPDQPAGYYYEASGRYGRLLQRIAAGEKDAELCAELRAILNLLHAGAPATGRYSANFERITRDVHNTSEAECEP